MLPLAERVRSWAAAVLSLTVETKVMLPALELTVVEVARTTGESKVTLPVAWIVAPIGLPPVALRFTDWAVIPLVSRNVPVAVALRLPRAFEPPAAASRALVPLGGGG